MKRRITQKLIEWKKKDKKNCLLINGARQVGKTYSVLEFAKSQYPFHVYINFDENPSYCEIFEGDCEAGEILKKISLVISGAVLEPHKTLIILDEIQNCPRARTALKFLSLDGRYDVIATGSLLGLNYKEVPSFPVGYTDRIEMYSLDFEEFLWANGLTEDNIAELKSYFDKKEPVPKAIDSKMAELFREYIVVGGMPASVLEFITNHNFASVLSLQRGILLDYADDIAKYADGAEKTKARACFNSIPKHLAKEYKKFRYSLVEKNGTNRKFGGSLQWLYDAGIVNFCYNLSVPELPLEGNARSDIFKVYMRDTGLLVAMLEDGSQKDIISGNLGIYKGAVYENIIADIFAKQGRKLYYFERNSTLEIDFVERFGDVAAAVEVKASNNQAKSLRSAIDNYGVKRAVKLGAVNIGMSNGIETYPLYMSFFLE